MFSFEFLCFIKNVFLFPTEIDTTFAVRKNKRSKCHCETYAKNATFSLETKKKAVAVERISDINCQRFSHDFFRRSRARSVSAGIDDDGFSELILRAPRFRMTRYYVRVVIRSGSRTVRFGGSYAVNACRDKSVCRRCPLNRRTKLFENTKTSGKKSIVYNVR